MIYMTTIMNGKWNLDQWYWCRFHWLIALYMPNQGTKKKAKLPPNLPFPFPPTSSRFFPLASLSYALLILSPSPPSIFLPHVLSIHCLSMIHLPSLPLTDSAPRVEDLLADPDPTHKRKVDNQLPLSAGPNRPSSEFPRDAGLLKPDCYPLSLIYWATHS